MGDKELIAQLLYEGEGTTLDFKGEQYRFSGATNSEKSKLLKDILAFANSWRQADAYILIGVKEVKGGRGEVIGISDHLDDASVQQLVNGKTQRAIEFSYKTIETEGVQIGVIHIPIQSGRPFYLKKDFGSLKESSVYIRRGSSTDMASPDEIAEMGQTAGGNPKALQLEAFLVSGEHDEILEKRANQKLINATIPSGNKFPEYGIEKIDVGFGMTIRNPGVTVNPNYYRDHARYIQAFSRVRGFKLAVKNLGEVPARDVKVVFEINNDNHKFIVCERKDLPREPVAETSIFNPNFSLPVSKEPDVDVKSTPTGWRVTCRLGKIQPKDMIATHKHLYLGAFVSSSIQLNGQIFSDDLPMPKNETLEIGYEVDQLTFSVDDFMKDNA